MTDLAIVMVENNSLTKTSRSIWRLSSNSVCLFLVSVKLPSPVPIHCLTFPQRWSTRLPMLLEDSLGLHQICSSVSWSKHSTIRGSDSSKSRCCTSLIRAVWIWVAFGMESKIRFASPFPPSPLKGGRHHPPTPSKGGG